MRAFAKYLILPSFALLASCAGFGGKKEPIDSPQIEEPAAAPKKEAPSDGVERIDGEIAPKPKKRGFWGNFAKALGADENTANVGPCPAVRVLYDSSRMVEITGANKFENVGFTGEILNVTSNCRYIGDEPIEVGMSLDMALGKGPKAEGDVKLVKYWVAVTRKDIVPIEKQNFTGEVIFPKGADRVRINTPAITINIPRRSKEVSGANFEILVGFDLDEKQLEFNRSGIRFKIDAGRTQ